MGRPKKIRAEGQAALDERVAEAEAAHALTEPKDEELSPAFLARTIDDAVRLYQEKYPDDWGECQNWPLQHALPHIAAKLRALG